MLKRFQILGWAVLAAAVAQSASAFSLLGPKETWQVANLGYSADFSESPHNLGEEFRWNVPLLYYTYDQTFLDYFGSNGVSEVDAGIAQLNGILTNKVSSWSADLSEFPLEASQINFTAAALHLFDLRSCAFELMIERVGLASPQPYTWTLHARVAAPSCPNYIYAVVKRNFDPLSFQPSVYVNGVLFTYWIEEFCPAVDEAITVPTPVDGSMDQDTAVAAGRIVYGDMTFYGRYYTGITRDDAGGLRYLYQTNNINIESPGPTGTTTYVTNTTASQLLYSSNLLALANSALTNSDAALAALYPNAVFSAVATTVWTNVWTTNITAYFTNSPWDAVGTAPHLVYTTNWTVTPMNQYNHSFANLLIPQFVDGAWILVPVTDITTLQRPAFATLQTVKVSSGSPFSAVGSTNIVTNVTSKVFVTNAISGEYFFLPTNLCSVQILANQLTLTNTMTNLIYSATNSATNGVVGSTNSVASTNVSYVSQSIITYSTNHVFVVFPVGCPTATLSARQGMDSVFRLERRDYDSLINRYWTPVTNTWTGLAITNNTTYVQTMSRVLVAPDILFAASDLLLGDVNFSVERSVPVWDTNGVPVDDTYQINGPGTIQPSTLTTFTLNKVGDVYYNIGPIYMDEATASTDFLWGSFDGTTNAPVIYPDSAGVAGYQNQILLQVFPGSLPNGVFGVPYTFSYVNSSSGVAYTTQFSGAGGQPPYSFAVTPGSSLPAGLAVQSDGTVTGSPAVEGGPFTFSIRMTDSGARYVDAPYAISISPP